MNTSTSPATRPVDQPFRGPIKIAVHVSESALAPIERARQLITDDLGLGEAPSLSLMLEIALLRVDPDELATSCMTTILGRQAPRTRELPLDEPPLDADLPDAGTRTE